MRGFSLLELMVTLAVLAALAFTASAYLQPAVDTAREPVAQYGMREVAAAILRFHQDTGFWPRTGLYASDSGKPYLGSDSPADLSQLFGPASRLFCPTSQPFCSSGLPASLNWNPDTRRGWHGPYLAGLTSPWVMIGPSYPADETGSASTSGAAFAVRGVGDGFLPLRPAPPSGFLTWWLDQLATKPTSSRGQPLLFFVPGATNFPAGYGCVAPCLVSLGPDGIYGNDDDNVFNF